MSGFGNSVRALPQTPPLFNGKRGNYQGGWGSPSSGIDYLSSGSPAKRARGYNTMPYAGHDQKSVFSQLTATPISEAQTGVPWLNVEGQMKFDLITPPDLTARERYTIGKYADVQDVWTAEHIIFTIATLQNMRGKAKSILALTRRMTEDQDILGPPAGQPQAIVSPMDGYMHALVHSRLNWALSEVLRPEVPRHQGLLANGQSVMEVAKFAPFPSVADVMAVVGVAGVSNNEMSSRDKRNVGFRQFARENSVINIVAGGKTGLLSPVTPAVMSTLTSILLIAEYARSNVNLYQLETDSAQTRAPEGDKGMKGTMVQVRAWSKPMSPDYPLWCLPSLRELRSIDAHGCVQLSKVTLLGHYRDTRRIRQARKSALPSLDHSEFSLSGSNLINAYVDIRPYH